MSTSNGTSKSSYTLAFNHVGVCVTDILKAINWYRDILGFELIRGPIDLSDKDLAAREVFGEAFKGVRQAHMTTANGVGIELFEFTSPKSQQRTGSENFEYWKTGYFHISVTVRDVTELLKRIEDSGGRVRTKVWEFLPGTLLAYCEDPFGNILELCNQSYEQTHANRGLSPIFVDASTQADHREPSR